MRHRKQKGMLSRNTSQRNALLSGLARNLILKERINTTFARAKQAQRLADRLVTLGKKNTIHSRRLAHRIIPDNEILKILFTDISPRFKDRNGGYTRVIRIADRCGDGSKMALLEFVVRKPKPEKTKEKKAKAKEKEKPEQIKPVKKHEPKTEAKAETKPETKPEVKPPVVKEKKEEIKEKKPEAKKGGFLKNLRGIFKQKKDEQEY